VTLIELLIVMSILIVISALGLPTVLRMVERSRLTSAAKELQAELNRTRLESMKSGEPLVFHYQPGTGSYEIMSKQDYDLYYPPQQFAQPFPPQSFPPNGGMMPDMAMPPPSGMMPPDANSPTQAVGSSGPSLADYGSTSLTDSVAAVQNRSLTDSAVNASSLSDYGQASSLTDLFAQPAPDMQMIAAIPVSKFLSVNKILPHHLTFDGLQGAGSRELGGSFPSPVSSLQPPASGLYSEPIFFFPNGRTSNAHFSVCSTDGRGYYIDVTMRGLTGTARLGDLEVMP